VKRLGLVFKFGFKFPVGGSVPVIFISNFQWGILNSSSMQQGGGGGGLQCLKTFVFLLMPAEAGFSNSRHLKCYIYIYIYRQVSSLESYMSRVLNTVVELIRLEDKIELLHMNFIS
jgi:hypothetical protein